MFKYSRKALPGLFVILAMLLGAWTTPRVAQSPNSSSNDNENHSNIPDKIDASKVVSNNGDLQLSGYLGDISGVQDRINTINSFELNMGAISKSNVSSLDKDFVSDSLDSNTLELWTIEYALDHGVKDPNLRDFLLMMLAMHSKDLQTTIDLANKLGIDTTVDFTSSSVYPETPAYDLGVRTENLKMDYLDHLVEPAKVSFDEVTLDILDKEHVDDVQGEMAAERETSNPEMKAFTKHAADVTELHLQLMDILSAHISTGYDEAPTPDYQKPYMSPRTITVHGSSQSQ